MRLLIGRVIIAAITFFAAPLICAERDRLANQLPDEEVVALSLKQELLDSLDNIKYTFRIKYAPKAWKRQFVGWNLEEQVAEAKSKALESESLSLEDCRAILIKFFNSCADYHVKVAFHSTAYSYLPFRVKSSQGHYFITWIDKPLLFDRGMKLKVGDEIVAFDDRAIGEVIAEIQSTYLDRGAHLTDHALAELFLTLRIGEEGLQAKKGDVSIEVIRRGACIKGTLEWIYAPEEIASPLTLVSKDVSNSRNADDFLRLQMKTPLYDTIAGVVKKLRRSYPRPDEIIDDNFFVLGGHTSYVPALGKIIKRFSSIKPFYAYIYEHPIDRRRIGYLRIPIYESAEGENVKEFAKLIKEFEFSTDALVIDQVANPGGDVWYAYALASLLAKEPLIVPTHRFTISQEDVHQCLDYLAVLETIDTDDAARAFFGNTISGYDVDLEVASHIESYFQFIVDQWEAGKYITDSFLLYGLGSIKPHKACHYTKPILMLIDSLDFSSADLLPAILQDNGRAVVFGTRTAGAGGYVKKHSFPNFLGISDYTYTGSIAERLGRVPLENLGVTPDIVYHVSPTDIRQGYLGYAAAVNQEVIKLK